VALLLARTQYSLLTAPGSVRALCEEAVRCGADHLVLADANGLYGLWAFAREAARLGLAARFGAELVHQGRRVVAIARDRTGYSSLCTLLSELHGAAGAGPFDLASACAQHHAGLWFVSGDLELLPRLSAYLPRERLFVALPARGLDAGLRPPEQASAPAPAVQDRKLPDRKLPDRKLPDPGPRWPRSQLLAAAADLDLAPIAVHDVWFPTPADRALHHLLLAVKWGRTLRGQAAGERLDEDLSGIATAPPWACLPARGVAQLDFADQPEARARAAAVVADCTLQFAERSPPVFPPIAVPDGSTPSAELRARVAHGLAQRYGTSTAAEARAAHELAVIDAMGFAPYFLAVVAIAELARQRGIPCLGRGSAADSLVAYCLGLTDADPLRYGLLFERFLNPGRSDLPDIDLDFCWRRRDELLAAVYAHFGPDHVAMLATYSTCGPRSAYQEAAKALGVPAAEAARRSKLLPWHGHADFTFAAAALATPGFFRPGPRATLPEDSSVLPPAREHLLLGLAQRLWQAPRHLGVHPGGVVITPEPICRHAPLERAAKGVVVTQYDLHAVEGLGLVKIDLLGNRALTIVQDTVALLAGRGVRVPEASTVAEDEPRTGELLAHGGTLGCFQVESPAMRTLLRQLEARTMDRVIQAVALVRPGPAASGMKDAFIARARGLEPVPNAHPLLAEAFADTFGILLYQEDVIRAAMLVAGFDAAAGDLLRRQFGKAGAERQGFDAFLVAGLRRGLPRAALERLWAEMARFGAYSFCKAHAVSYGRLAHRCVYLKAHWPVAFLTAVLRNDAGYFAPGVYAEELKRLGGTLLPPCVQHGSAEHTLVDASTVRIGYGHVHGLGAATAAAIGTARTAGGPFRSLVDFLERVRPARDEAERLIRVGALTALGPSRPELLWRLQVALQPRARAERQRAKALARSALFASAFEPREAGCPPLGDFDEARRTAEELHGLGFALGSHPVDVLWRQGALRRPAGTVPCGQLEQWLGQRVAVCGLAVAVRGHRAAAGAMLFVTLEDGTGIVEATLFARVYEQCGGVVQGRGPFLVRGVVEERLGGVGLTVQEVVAVMGGEVE
jgi:DNA-directed DNA polymerase III PolC